MNTTTTKKVVHFLCEMRDVSSGCAKRIERQAQAPLAVFNLAGRFYVTDDTCTHGEASLSDGEIDGAIVECPYHQGAFDILTGKPAGAPCSIPIKTYEVILEDGGVYIHEDDQAGEDACPKFV